MVHQHAVSWFEIPTEDLARATAFYETVFSVQLIPMDFPHLQMRMFPVTATQGESVSGALVKSSDGFHIPSATHGPLVYLNANPSVEAILQKVEAAGGQVLVPQTEISPEYGYMGVFLDSEGNRIAVHAMHPR